MSVTRPQHAQARFGANAFNHRVRIIDWYQPVFGNGDDRRRRGNPCGIDAMQVDRLRQAQVRGGAETLDETRAAGIEIIFRGASCVATRDASNPGSGPIPLPATSIRARCRSPASGPDCDSTSTPPTMSARRSPSAWGLTPREFSPSWGGGECDGGTRARSTTHRSREWGMIDA